MAQYTHKTPQNHNPPYLSIYDIVYRYRTVYRFYYFRYRIRYRVRCLIFQSEQGGLLPALDSDRDAADVITGSEHIRCGSLKSWTQSSLAISLAVHMAISTRLDASSGKMNSLTVGRRQDAILSIFRATVFGTRIHRYNIDTIIVLH